MREYTPSEITELPENSIFVYGANGTFTHGKGAALIAKNKFGAVYGRRISGQSYGIITKKDWRVKKSSSLEEIEQEILDFLYYALINLHQKFYVIKIGSVLAGYSEDDIKNIFLKVKNRIPENVILPIEYEVRDNGDNNDKV